MAAMGWNRPFANPIPLPGGCQLVTLEDAAGYIMKLPYCETDLEATDLEIVIQDLRDGQYSNPVRVVSFNTAEGWARDISADVAEELRRRCDLQLREIPSNILDFIERHETASRASSRCGWSKSSGRTAKDGGARRGLESCSLFGSRRLTQP